MTTLLKYAIKKTGITKNAKGLEMITLLEGDILKANVEALVNTVNCVGVMGKGIALQFKKAFPENFREYKKICDSKELSLGKLFVFETRQITNPKYIVNFPTKNHWKGKSNLSDIETGLRELAKWIKDSQIKSIAIPPLGCGLGGLDWDDVLRQIKGALNPINNVEILIYEPKGAPKELYQLAKQDPPNMTQGRAALLGLMNEYLSALMDPFISLLEVHKLMYFMQEAGEPLKLKYTKGLYGPYAENLRHVLRRIEGHFIKGFQDSEDRPDKKIELKIEAVAKAREFLDQHNDTQIRFKKVANLVEGFETSYGMELLATVHWLAKQEGAITPEDTTTLAHKWSDKKKKFNEKHIKLAWDTLESQGWM